MKHSSFIPTRRGFLQGGAALSSLSLAAFADAQSTGTGILTPPGATAPVIAPDALASIGTLTATDVAVLRFSIANELIGGDLWSQYANQVLYNPSYTAALRAVDPMLPRYILDTVRDELSHGLFLTALGTALGIEPVSLEAFRTLPDAGAFAATGYGQGAIDPQLSTAFAGIQALGITLPPPGTNRIVNLTSLNLDSSFFNKYRTANNPDVMPEAPSTFSLTNQPTIPIANGSANSSMQLTAAAAVMHMSFNEQGESSAYLALGGALRNRELMGVMASIMPVEMMHYTLFQTSMSMLTGDGTNTSLPNFLSQRDTSPLATLPAPAPVFAGLPNVSVIRPKKIPNAGAVAVSRKLSQANYFAGQPAEFSQMMLQMAEAADMAGTIASLSPRGVTTSQREISLSTAGSAAGNGGPLTYSYRVLQGSASLSNGSSNAPAVQFLGGAGPYTFQLTVTDALGNQASDVTTIIYAGR